MGFKKVSSDNKKSSKYPGSLLNYKSNQTLLSSGIEGIDKILDGGFAIGSLYLFEKDYPTSFFKKFICKFVVDGLFHKHNVNLIGFDCDYLYQYIAYYNHYLNLKKRGSFDSLKSMSSNDKSEAPELVLDPDLKISWRYNYLKQSVTKNFTETVDKHLIYDLTIDQESLKKCSEIDGFSLLSEPNKLLDIVLSSVNLIKNMTENKIFNTSSSIIGRLIIDDFDLILNTFSSDNEKALFCYKLKSLLRRSSICCLIFIKKKENTESFDYINNLLNITCDAVFQLSSILTKPKDLDGYFHIKKLFSINNVKTYKFDEFEYSIDIHSRSLIHLEIKKSTILTGIEDEKVKESNLNNDNEISRTTESSRTIFNNNLKNDKFDSFSKGSYTIASGIKYISKQADINNTSKCCNPDFDF